MQDNRRKRIPHVHKSVDVNLVIFHRLQDELIIEAGGKIVGILFQHIHHVCPLRLGQERGRFGILRYVNPQVKGEQKHEPTSCKNENETDAMTMVAN
jgi:hypothetical protein